jgi:hypothetical protein
VGCGQLRGLASLGLGTVFSPESGPIANFSHEVTRKGDEANQGKRPLSSPLLPINTHKTAMPGHIISPHRAIMPCMHTQYLEFPSRQNLSLRIFISSSLAANIEKVWGKFCPTSRCQPWPSLGKRVQIEVASAVRLKEQGVGHGCQSHHHLCPPLVEKWTPSISSNSSRFLSVFRVLSLHNSHHATLPLWSSLPGSCNPCRSNRSGNTR